MPAEITAAIDDEIRGLDVLEIPRTERDPLQVRLWKAAWPKLMALGIGLGVWELVVLSGWKPTFVLPPPHLVFGRLWADLGTGTFRQAVGNTMERAFVGFAIAILIGTLVGLAVSQSRILRSAVGSLIAGFQSMPSIVWFPFAILLFGLTESRDSLRGDPRSSAGGCERTNRRNRSHPPDLVESRAHTGCSGPSVLAPCCPASSTPGLRGRAQTGMGVRLAITDGRRTARDHRRKPRYGGPPPLRPRILRCRWSSGNDDSGAGYFAADRRVVLRHDRARHPSQPGAIDRKVAGRAASHYVELVAFGVADRHEIVVDLRGLHCFDHRRSRHD